MSAPLATKLALVDTFEPGYLEFNGIYPLDVVGDRVRVAVVVPPAIEVQDHLERHYGAPIEIIVVSHEVLTDAIRATFAAQSTLRETIRDLEAEIVPTSESLDTVVADATDVANKAPVIKLVYQIIQNAYDAGASDIHLEATRDGMLVRLRLDGVLTEAGQPPKGFQAAVISRVKLIAQLDIAERRVPQDGRIRVKLRDRELDLRVSTLPTLYGESVVLRLLDRGGQPVSLEHLGMPVEIERTMRQLAARPHGIVLATGPTGSGKTTTLYAALALRNAATEKILTVEDPIEYYLPGIAQVPVHPKGGLTFAGALRSMLRHDPNVLMVGEMRDTETAGIAIQAAMTGHLVFSTLHTNDAPSAVARLADLGVEPTYAAGALEGILAQRLVRKNCPDCSEPYDVEPELVALLAREPIGAPVQLRKGVGCLTCRHTGYKGRTGIFELLVVTDELKHAVARREPVAKLRALAEEQGLRSLRADGWTKVQGGITTVEEVLRVTEH